MINRVTSYRMGAKIWSPEMKEALNKFNKNLLLKFNVIFEYELYEVVKNKKEISADQEFLVYDTACKNGKEEGTTGDFTNK